MGSGEEEAWEEWCPVSTQELLTHMSLLTFVAKCLLTWRESFLDNLGLPATWAERGPLGRQCFHHEQED